MFEFDKYDRNLHNGPPAMPSIPYEPAADVEGMSLLLWAEHCVECAAPACYSSCDLYQPRLDSRCRRFGFGAYKNRSFPSMRGYGVEISFKKWAKIEAFGNTAIYPMRSVLRWERALERGARLTNVIGRFAHRLSNSSNWEQLTYIATGKLGRALHRRGVDGEQPDAFLLEVYNPAAKDVKLQIIFGVSTDDVAGDNHSVPQIPLVLKTLSLPPGYSRHEFEASAFRRIADRGLPFKITMVPEADNNARLVFLTADLVKFKQGKVAARKTQIKCVVWDLDNTLWNGTLVEGDDVVLRNGVAELLKYLDERGVLVSIASKNDFAPAFEKLRQFGVADYFLYPQIDWVPKSQKIRNIAQKLNLGLDTFAFIDDNPFELEEVSRVSPEVVCIRAGEIESLAADERFQGSVTEESRQRRHFYRDQVSRETDQAGFGDDYTSFLGSCEIVLDLAYYSPNDQERVAELVQRTNQLNFSGRKYSRAALDEIIADRNLDKYVLRCADKYGSYGTVGFCLIRHEAGVLQVVDFMLSCRVQGKFIEQALFSHLLEHHNAQQARTVWVNFQQTDRNTPARGVLDALGFRACAPEEGDLTGGMILRLSEPLSCDFIEMNCAAAEAYIHAVTTAV
ncbi:MAG: HAD-IIIC family phosphatase [Candidatus Binataceae bacterium]